MQSHGRHSIAIHPIKGDAVNDEITTTIPARELRAGMFVSTPHYNRGALTEIASVEPMGDALIRITFVDYERTNTTYCVGIDHGIDVQAVSLEMWTVNPDGTPGDTYAMRFPVGKRRHDMLRTLASYALATHDVGRYYTRVPRRYIRVNSTQGVAWDTRNVSRVAYFNN